VVGAAGAGFAAGCWAAANAQNDVSRVVLKRPTGLPPGWGAPAEIRRGLPAAIQSLMKDIRLPGVLPSAA
jgi:hypothetical protein